MRDAVRERVLMRGGSRAHTQRCDVGSGSGATGTGTAGVVHGSWWVALRLRDRVGRGGARCRRCCSLDCLVGCRSGSLAPVWWVGSGLALSGLPGDAACGRRRRGRGNRGQLPSHAPYPVAGSPRDLLSRAVLDQRHADVRAGVPPGIRRRRPGDGTSDQRTTGGRLDALRDRIYAVGEAALPGQFEPRPATYSKAQVVSVRRSRLEPSTVVVAIVIRCPRAATGTVVWSAAGMT